MSEVANQGIPVLWFPPGCWSDEAVSRGEELGLEIIHDLCPMGQLAALGSP